MANDKIKQHESCNFGLTKFNKTKRSKEFLEEIISTSTNNRPRGKSNKVNQVISVRVSVIDGYSLNLTWTSVTGALSYAIYRNGSYISSSVNLSYLDNNLVPGTTYYYQVAAVDSSNVLGTLSAQSTGTTKTVANQPSVIFLDFKGTIVTGTSWNYAGDINAGPSGLTPDEQAAILANCQQDYLAYNVIVTNDESVYNSANPAARIRCIITESYEWYGSSAGGVAYTGSFTWGNNTPCFVFSSLLGYNVKSIQEAVSHEIGHTIGLRHQAVWDENCVLISSYNYGGNGEAPIMGVGYYQPNVHWWIGPTSQGCTNIQNDHEFLVSKLGLK